MATLETLAMALALVAAAPLLPWFLGNHVLAVHRHRRLQRRTNGCPHASARLVSDGLKLSVSGEARTVPWTDLKEIEIVHLQGDNGFADGNTLYYVLSWLPESGRREGVTLTQSHPFSMRSELFLPLQERGVIANVSVVRGPFGGFGVFMMVPLWIGVLIVAYFLGSTVGALGFVALSLVASLLFALYGAVRRPRRREAQLREAQLEFEPR